MATRLPSGTVTFLFTDIEGSTRLVEALGSGYADVLDEHRRLIRGAVVAHGGVEVGTEGDSFFVAFPAASAGVAAAVDAQLAIERHEWPPPFPVRVRMGLHTGEATVHDGNYVGMTVHRTARISAAAHGGQVLISAATRELAADLCSEALDLGVHRLKDLTRSEHLFQVRHDGLPDAFPPPRTLSLRRHNLPEPLTHFIGRSGELSELRALVLGERLVSVIGPGGAGKTRLAIEVARLSVDEFDGVTMVELAGLSDAELAPSAVAAALAAPQQGGAAIEVVADLVGDRRLLLLLDNCEHVLSGCRDLAATLLERCPNIAILSTSREPLGLSGEVLWRIPALPSGEGLPPAELLADPSVADGVALFVDRSRLAGARFELSEANVEAVARVCQRLDGLPLAIELAAARTNVLAVDQIDARLGDRFQLLRSSATDRATRHQTLQAAVDWSYELLDEPERDVFRRLGVFSGGFSLEAAEMVCAGDAVAAEGVLDLLGRLVEKSLVVADASGDTARFDLLDSIRAYARSALEAHGDEHEARGKHLTWIAREARGAADAMTGCDDLEWLARFDRDLDNVRRAVAWGLEHDPAATLELLGDLWVYWWTRGYLSEARSFLDDCLARVPTGPGANSRALANGHAAASFLAYCQDDADALTRHAEAAVEIGGDAGGGPEFAWSTAWALIDLGELAQQRCDLATTRARFERALAVALDGRHEYSVARSYQQLAYLTEAEGQADEALALARLGLAKMRERRNRVGISRLLYCLARILWGAGKPDAAREAYDESLAESEQAGDLLGIRGAYEGLGTLAYERGDVFQGRAAFEQVLEVTKDLGQPALFQARQLLTLGSTAAAAGDARSAREWLERGLALAARASDDDQMKALTRELQDAMAGVPS